MSGITAAMEKLGEVAQQRDGLDIPLDKWSLEAIQNGDPGVWNPDKIKIIRDFFQSTDWNIFPLTLLACTSLERAPISTRRILRARHICTLLATTTISGTRFVRLLLEPGADPHAAGSEGRTCIDAAKSVDIFHIFIMAGVDMTQHANKALLGIGQLDPETVQLALEAGVDISCVEDKPLYSYPDVGWETHPTVLLYHDNLRPQPLRSSLSIADIGGEQVTKDPRGDTNRLVINSVAELFKLVLRERYYFERYEVYHVKSPPMNLVFEMVMCERRYLEVLLEFVASFSTHRLVSLLNARDPHTGSTLFLAAFRLEHAWLPGFLSYDDSSHLFLEVMDLAGAKLDMTTIDLMGNNALHILLDGRRAYVSFLSRPEVRPLVSLRDKEDFMPLQLAFKQLRTAVADRLLSIIADKYGCESKKRWIKERSSNVT
ncbi:hypothetical protein HD806DRAFT_533144 [Xylariaceae sp. AK1471]|nr:hypothetical protein HD806DRAFT_533144 [Xylariaceae sp. AK1471]